MIWPALILAICAAALLLASGYLLGIKRGYRAREALREQSLQQAKELARLREQLSEQDAGSIQALRTELENILDPVLRQVAAVPQILEPLMQREKEDEHLRARIQQVLTPLMWGEQLSAALANLPTGAGRRNDLINMLDQIADKGGFTPVLLSDPEGWPLAANSKALNSDKLAVLSPLILELADRISRDKAPAPLAVIIHDEAGKLTLCRIFRVGSQRLLLMAVSTEAPLTPTALDPALAKLTEVLSSPAAASPAQSSG